MQTLADSGLGLLFCGFRAVGLGDSVLERLERLYFSLDLDRDVLVLELLVVLLLLLLLEELPDELDLLDPEELDLDPELERLAELLEDDILQREHIRKSMLIYHNWQANE